MLGNDEQQSLQWCWSIFSSSQISGVYPWFLLPTALELSKYACVRIHPRKFLVGSCSCDIAVVFDLTLKEMGEPMKKKNCRRIEVCVDVESGEWCTVVVQKEFVIKDILNALLIDNYIPHLQGFGLATQDNIETPVSYNLFRRDYLYDSYTKFFPSQLKLGGPVPPQERLWLIENKATIIQQRAKRVILNGKGCCSKVRNSV